MEIEPCRYLFVNETGSKTNVPKQPERPRDPSKRTLISAVWAVAGTGTLFLVDKGFSVLSYSPPSFALARWFFGASAALLILAIAITARQVHAPFAVRAMMTAGVVFSSFCLLLVGLMWIAWRESDFRSHQQASVLSAQPTATQGTAAAVSTGSPQAAAPQSSTNAANGTITLPETSTSGFGSHDVPFTNADVWKIIEPYDSRTSVQADAIAGHYVGQWVKFDSKIYDVNAFLDQGYYLVGIELEDKSQHKRLMVTARISDAKAEAIKYLNPGDHVVVLGKIESVGFRKIVLDKCEVISP